MRLRHEGTFLVVDVSMDSKCSTMAMGDWLGCLTFLIA